MNVPPRFSIISWRQKVSDLQSTRPFVQTVFLNHSLAAHENCFCLGLSGFALRYLLAWSAAVKAESAKSCIGLAVESSDTASFPDQTRSPLDFTPSKHNIKETVPPYCCHSFWRLCSGKWGMFWQNKTMQQTYFFINSSRGPKESKQPIFLYLSLILGHAWTVLKVNDKKQEHCQKQATKYVNNWLYDEMWNWTFNQPQKVCKGIKL